MARVGGDWGVEYSKGADGWELDWAGARVKIKAAAAAKIGIQTCMELAVEKARSNHPDYPPESEPFERYHRRTDQTIAATQILEDADIKDWVGSNPYVTGRWGIRDAPAFQDPDEWREVRGFTSPPTGGLQKVSIVDRALFLEFGTVRMAPRPFIYPAWDETKILLPGLIAAAYRAMGGGQWTAVGLH